MGKIIGLVFDEPVQEPDVATPEPDVVPDITPEIAPQAPEGDNTQTSEGDNSQAPEGDNAEPKKGRKKKEA